MPVQAGSMKERLEKWLAFEEAHGLFDRRYHDVHYWQLVRVLLIEEALLHTEIRTLHADTMTAQAKASRLAYLKDAVPQLLRAARAPKTDVLYVASDCLRTVQGKELNPYIDFYDGINAFSHRKFILTSGYPCKTKCDQSSALLQLRLDLAYPFRWIAGRLPIPREIRTLAAQIEAEVGFAIGVRRLYRFIVTEVGVFRVRRAFYTRLLHGRYRAVVKCDEHYSSDGYALAAAAHACGIPFVECQHGLITAAMPEYRYFERSRRGKYLPDACFLYGALWMGMLRMPEGCEGVAVGSPFFDYAKSEHMGCARQPDTVVFYSSMSVAPELPELAAAFAEIAAPFGYRVLYKFHPSERESWRVRYPKLAACAAIEPIDSGESVYACFAQYEYHVGVSSVSLLEALALGLGGRVFALSCAASELVQDVLPQGAIPTFSDAEGLLALLRRPSSEVTVCDPSSIYRPNALANFENEMLRLLHQR